jgi:hypothetical protein
MTAAKVARPAASWLAMIYPEAKRGGAKDRGFLFFDTAGVLQPPVHYLPLVCAARFEIQQVGALRLQVAEKQHRVSFVG